MLDDPNTSNYLKLTILIKIAKKHHSDKQKIYVTLEHRLITLEYLLEVFFKKFLTRHELILVTTQGYRDKSFIAQRYHTKKLIFHACILSYLSVKLIVRLLISGPIGKNNDYNMVSFLSTS